MNKSTFTGEVWKLKNNLLVIVFNITKDGAEWIAFGSSNFSGYTYNKTRKVSHLFRLDNRVVDDPGFDQAEYLAKNVKEYILKRLLKNFDF